VQLLLQAALTAVYALADHHTIRWTAEQDPVRKIAGVCRIVSGATVPTLACAGPAVSEPRTGRRYLYSVVLFRDLEENLYLAACAASTRQDRCNDLRAGQTFSAEVEEQSIRVVIDEEQLGMRVLEHRPKPVTIDSPTRGAPSQVKPSPGSPSIVSWSKAPASNGAPSQIRPSEVSVAAGAPSRVSTSEVSTATASPRFGRLTLYCEAPHARVFIDGKLVGTAPLETPVLPGRHLVRVVAPGRPEWMRTVVIPPGGSVKVAAELGR
jgi:hypothetical protein